MVSFLKLVFNFDLFVIITLIIIFNSDFEVIKAGTIDENFKAVVINGKYGENIIPGQIKDIKQQSDGKLIIAGNFIYFNNDSSKKHIIRIFPDGTIDTTFHSSFQFERSSDIISTILIQDSGKLLVGGRFETVEGCAVSNFVRLSPNGRLDKRFNKKVLAYGHSYCGNEIPPVLHSIFKLDNKFLLLTGYLTVYDSHYVFMSPVIIDNDGELVNKYYDIKKFNSEFIDNPFSLRAFLNIKDDFYMNFLNRLGNNVIGYNRSGKIIIFGLEGIIAINQNGMKDSAFFTIPAYSREAAVVPKNSDLFFDQSTTNFIVLNDDKILVCGKTYIKGKNDELVPAEVAIVKYLPNGKIDHSFKVDSNLLNVIPELFSSEQLPILEDSDGKLLIGSSRFTKDGHLDYSFALPNDRINQVLDSRDSYYFVEYNVIYKVSKYPKINFFGWFSITLD